MTLVETNVVGGTTVDTTGGDIQLSGVLSGPGALTKTGVGELHVIGDHGYSGTTFVAAGILSGSGRITGDMQIQSAGTLAPGGLSTTAVFTVSNNVAFVGGGVLQIDLNGTIAGADYDQLVVTGALDLGNVAELWARRRAGFVPRHGESFTIVEGFSSLNGTFKGLPEGAAVPGIGGLDYIIHYDVSGKNIMLTATHRGFSILIR